MTPIYLFDTGVVSLPVNPRADRLLANRFERIAASGRISATTLCELLYGANRLPVGARRTDLQDYLRDVLLPRVSVLDYTAEAAEWHAAERARLEAVGLTPPFADGQIAAVAAVNDLTLVTLNAGDFERFDGVRIESWAA